MSCQWMVEQLLLGSGAGAGDTWSRRETGQRYEAVVMQNVRTDVKTDKQTNGQIDEQDGKG